MGSTVIRPICKMLSNYLIHSHITFYFPSPTLSNRKEWTYQITLNPLAKTEALLLSIPSLPNSKEPPLKNIKQTTNK